MSESPVPVSYTSTRPPPMTVGRALRVGGAFAFGGLALVVVALVVTWWLLAPGGSRP